MSHVDDVLGDVAGELDHVVAALAALGAAFAALAEPLSRDDVATLRPAILDVLARHVAPGCGSPCPRSRGVARGSGRAARIVNGHA